MIRNITAVFICLGIVFIPVKSFLLPFQPELAAGVFGTFLNRISQSLGWPTSHIYSDSPAMLMMLALLLIFSVLTVCILKWTGISFLGKAEPYFRTVFYYYLALQLFGYGSDKVFLQQFYQPEPNILYSRFGMLDKDILYWSTMGTSPAYNLFLGLTEILASILLLFKRTRLAGAFMTLILLINILMVNISFGITVKLLSSFLLLINLYLLQPWLRDIFRLFFSRKPLLQRFEEEKVSLPFIPAAFMKSFAILFILFEGLVPHLKEKNSPPPFHGGWEILQSDSPASPLLRFYVHRHGFFITEDHRGEMKDYRLRIDTVAHSFHLLHYNTKETRLPYRFHAEQNVLELTSPLGNGSWLKARRLNWESLPALR